MAKTGAPANLGDFKEYTSGADLATWAAPNLAEWALIEGAGSTVLTTEAGAAAATPYNRTVTTDAATPNKLVFGPFTALVSMSGPRVTLGCGRPPGMPSVPASAVPATASALGGVEMSVAPAAALTPIAVGNNDTRVTTVEVPLPLGTDCSLGESTAWTAPVACTVTAIYIETGGKAIAASNSNYCAITVNKRPLSLPGTPAAMVTTTTKAADLNATAAWTDKSLGALANTSLAAGDKVTFTSATTGTITGGVPGLLRITYTVP